MIDSSPYATVIAIMGLELSADGARRCALALRREAAESGADSGFYRKMADELDRLAGFKQMASPASSLKNLTAFVPFGGELLDEDS